MLVSLPNLRNLSSDKELNSLQQFVARRALLFDQQATNEDLAMDELITFAGQRPPQQHDEHGASFPDQHERSEGAEEPQTQGVLNATRKRFGELFLQIGQSIIAKLPVDLAGTPLDLVGTPSRPLGNSPEFDSKATRKRTIEFDIDDSWPPEKKKNLTTNVIHHVL